MGINFVAILIASVLQFIFGAIWYTPLFGKLWGKIHGFDKIPKSQQKEMMKTMGPFLGIQFIMTVISTVILDIFIVYLPQDWNVYALAAFFWLGFIVPAQVSGVIFGGTEGKWVLHKIAIQAGAAFFCIEIAAAVLHFI